MAKKRVRYPRTFRQTLEKIAEARDARDGRAPSDAANEADMEKVFSTFWHEFLGNGSVALAHAMINEQRHKLCFRYAMKLRRTSRIVVPAPWESEESPAPP
jgi:hypothetical protein